MLFTAEGRTHLMKKHPRTAAQAGTIPPIRVRPAGQQYSGYPGQGEYQQPYDWRYAQQPARPPYDPYRDMRQCIPPTAPIPQPRKRSRAGVVMIGAAAVAVASGGVGAVVLAAQPDRPAPLRAAIPAAVRSRPARRRPARRFG